MFIPLILAGGSGTRLWPLSREFFPKQLHSLTSASSLFQDTIERLEHVAHQPPLIVCNEEHRFIIAEQLRQRQISHSGIILEPIGRNTAPAIALGALNIQKNYSADSVVLVLSADHMINDAAYFCKKIEQSTPLANMGKLVTFGIVPSSPETGYGYIKQGKRYNTDAYTIANFIEKPNVKMAQKYLIEGGYYWNSGMFMFKVSSYLDELQKYRPDILDTCKQAISGARMDLDFIRLDEPAFLQSPSESIDYAVMEHTDNAVVVPLDTEWNDVGSWSSLWAISQKDENQNVLRGDIVAEDTSNSYIYAQDKLVTALGITDLIIVETKDAILIADKNNVQNIKSIVNKLQKAGRQECLHHREIYRPWGSYDSIASGARYDVKKVIVKPGGRIATQIHYHRAEHWIVVSGTAKVYSGDQSFVITENESTYIPIGVSHSIENIGKVPLEVIEVRTGTYLAEDDVERIGNNAGMGY